MPDADYVVSNGEVLASRTGDRVWRVPAAVTCHLPSGSGKIDRKVFPGSLL